MNTEFTIKDNQVKVEMDRTNIITMNDKSVIFERVYSDGNDNAIELSWQELFNIIMEDPWTLKILEK